MTATTNGRGSRYMLERVDGRQRRWSGWAATLPDARAKASAKAAPGFPIAIVHNRTGRTVEIVEASP